MYVPPKLNFTRQAPKSASRSPPCCRSFRLRDLMAATAETAYNQALLNRIQARATRYEGAVALFQALGGGWWNRTTPAAVARSVH